MHIQIGLMMQARILDYYLCIIVSFGYSLSHAEIVLNDLTGGPATDGVTELVYYTQRAGTTTHVGSEHDYHGRSDLYHYVHFNGEYYYDWGFKNSADQETGVVENWARYGEFSKLHLSQFGGTGPASIFTYAIFQDGHGNDYFEWADDYNIDLVVTTAAEKFPNRILSIEAKEQRIIETVEPGGEKYSEMELTGNQSTSFLKLTAGDRISLSDLEGAYQYGISDFELLKMDLEADKAASGIIQLPDNQSVTLYNPQSFSGDAAESGDPCTEDDARALVVFRSETSDGHDIVQDYSVTLRFGNGVNAPAVWTKLSGPDSGVFSNANQSVETYTKPELAGHYQFDATLDSFSIRTNLYLPLGGPDVTDYFLSEATRYDNWLTQVRNRVQGASNSQFVQGLLIMGYFTKTVNNMNHKIDDYQAEDSPCEKYCANTVTIKEHVFGKDQIGNFLFGYLAARTGFTMGTTTLAANLVSYLQDGVPDNPDDIAAFQAAFEWGENPSQDFKTILESRKVKEMQGEAAKRGWP